MGDLFSQKADFRVVRLSEADARGDSDHLKELRELVLENEPMYEDMFNSWRRIEFDIANHSAGGRKKARKQETLWLNW